MKNYISKRPIASFAIPADPPAEVADAAEHFDDVADRYALLLGEISDAEAELADARTKDLRALADAYTAGTEPANVDEHEEKAKAKVDQLRNRLPALELAVDEVGNQLCDVIGLHAAEWAADQRARIDDAANSYDEAIAAAIAALDTLGRAESARVWLEAYDADEAKLGEHRYHGKPAPLVVSDNMRKEHSAPVLLQLAARATTTLDRAHAHA